MANCELGDKEPLDYSSQLMTLAFIPRPFFPREKNGLNKLENHAKNPSPSHRIFFLLFHLIYAILKLLS